MENTYYASAKQIESIGGNADCSGAGGGGATFADPVCKTNVDVEDPATKQVCVIWSQGADPAAYRPLSPLSKGR